ncbi:MULTISPECIES: PPK2 family polyphosphate kinase [Dermacoccus]|uniref:Polyphosphate kinase 2 family protein n=2 Tax=Dermacoccus TaxID=57495 RepID=A0A417Z6G4_9MICO|nr:PPK2 family polyphosphate kinase [Dermacoccus abyssi]RHW46201.1 polyphosphate kinase 2 family protein [Dermacoccus abyssi]
MGKNKDKASANADADTKSKKRDDELTSSDKKKVAEQASEKAAKAKAKAEKAPAKKKGSAKKASSKPATEAAKKAKKDEAVKAAKKVGKDKSKKKHKAQLSDFTSALKVTPGFSLADLDASSTPAFDGDQKKAEKLMRKTGEELADLQERLYASERHPDGRSVLLVVQGMDTSGKGGIMRHVIGSIDPQGVELTSFKAPTKEEQAHPFLWRIRNALPKPGYIGVFDRSQYEDVLIVRVHDLVSRPVWMRRYGQINAFEESTVAKNTTIIKVMLHIDADEQKARLAERLDNPEKFYKFNPGDLKERAYWPEYQDAYQAVLERTSTDIAPWFVVPANNKWYARLAVQQLLLEHLRSLDLTWPEATFDVEEQKAALAQL